MTAFRFKQFAIQQDRCPMKVGTDGVLLGAWARVAKNDRRLLDIGTGTGLIALMLAQRTSEADITGIDINSVEQACENAKASPWASRLHFVQIPVQDFEAAPFDHILSNPPFYVDSLTCPDAGRTTARHAVTLSYADLCEAVLRLLAPDGRFSLILPVSEADRFLSVSRGRLFLTRRTEVSTTPRRAVRRVLMEFSKQPHEAPEYGRLVVGTGAHEEFTAEYKALTRDFYLKF